MSNELIDIIDTETLDETVRREALARMTISSALDRKNLLTTLRSIVEESTCLNFVSERASRFISAQRPELRLNIDREAVAAKYPDTHYLEICNAVDDNEMRVAKDALVHVEVKNEIIEFFTGVFVLILTGDHMKGLTEKQMDRVNAITQSLDLDTLRSTVNDIFKKRDKDGNITEELGFSYGVISSVTFPSEEGEIMTNDLAVIEIVY